MPLYPWHMRARTRRDVPTRRPIILGPVTDGDQNRSIWFSSRMMQVPNLQRSPPSGPEEAALTSAARVSSVLLFSESGLGPRMAPAAGFGWNLRSEKMAAREDLRSAPGRVRALLPSAVFAAWPMCRSELRTTAPNTGEGGLCLGSGFERISAWSHWGACGTLCSQKQSATALLTVLWPAPSSYSSYLNFTWDAWKAQQTINVLLPHSVEAR